MKIKRIARVSILCAAVLTDSCLAAADTVAAPWFSHDGTIDLVSSNHQDTAWMDTPAACRKFRIEHNIIRSMSWASLEQRSSSLTTLTDHGPMRVGDTNSQGRRPKSQRMEPSPSAH